MSVSTIRQNSQRPVDAPLPTRSPPPLFSEEAGRKTANSVVTMQSLKERVTCHDVMAMDDSIQKGTPTPKGFQSRQGVTNPG